MSDFRWQTKGGLLLDGTGDIATTLSPIEELETMVETRLKTSANGWQLYQIGADLQSFIGSTISPDLLLTIERQVQSVLTRQFLPAGTFTVNAINSGQAIEVYVFLADQLIATFEITVS
jgi:hypothetical protein